MCSVAPRGPQIHRGPTAPCTVLSAGVAGSSQSMASGQRHPGS